MAERIIETAVLPSVAEQAGNLVRWLGEHQPGRGEFEMVSDESHGAIVGTLNMDGLEFVIKGLVASRLIESMPVGGMVTPCRLTFAGWERSEELRRGAASGTKAFMAMHYGDPTLNRIVDEHFRLAVDQTGFRLTVLRDVPKAGLIDNLMSSKSSPHASSSLI